MAEQPCTAIHKEFLSDVRALHRALIPAVCIQSHATQEGKTPYNVDYLTHKYTLSSCCPYMAIASVVHATHKPKE